ncbi:MAG: amidohydrolase family protein [Dehalococcoidia bacterium]|nr:amidohydrolase family protein [Dehalococcoidia bacterium]
MIIDFHTHIFPPTVREKREEYLRRDAIFAELYSNPKAKIATADDLLRSMDEAAIDVSVALGFAWGEHELCEQHNDYLLKAAAQSNGRIVPFCTVNPCFEEADEEAVRCARAGARGLGELRPDSQGWDPNGDAGEVLAAVAQRCDLMLLFHVSEPVGRKYPGKEGGSLGAFYEFARQHPRLRTIGAHLAGGLPFYAPMPEVREVFAHVLVDTAAQRLLYDKTTYGQLVHLIGAERVLLGSDYPLVSQSRQIQELRAGVFRSDDLQLMLGGNAQRLLALPDDSP